MRHRFIVALVLSVLSSAAAGEVAGPVPTPEATPALLPHAEKGSVILGADTSLSFFSQDFGGDFSNDFGLNIHAGRFVTDYLAPFTGFAFSMSSVGFFDFTSLSFGAGLRAYWNRKTRLLPYIWVLPSVVYGRVSAPDGWWSDTDSVSDTGFQLAGGVGTDYLILKNFALGAVILYSRSWFQGSAEEQGVSWLTGNPSQRIGIRLSFGFYF